MHLSDILTFVIYDIPTLTRQNSFLHSKKALNTLQTVTPLIILSLVMLTSEAGHNKGDAYTEAETFNFLLGFSGIWPKTVCSSISSLAVQWPEL